MAQHKKSSPRDSYKKGYKKKVLIHSVATDVDLIESKHHQIMEGAYKLFFEKGFHPTTIREIAHECNMSMGQLYHYISSKDDILFLAHEHISKVWHEHLKKSGIEEIQDPLRLFVAALRHTLEFIEENRKLFLFAYTETKYLNKKYLRAVLEMDDRNVVGFWRQLLKKLNERKVIKSDRNFAANLIAYLLVFFALRGWNLKEMRTGRKLDFLIDFIMRGLGVVQ